MADQFLLLLQAPGRSAAAFRLCPGCRNVVGRAPDCDVIIDDGSVSRRHAELQVAQSGLAVRDLGSLNGTFVEGTRVTSSEVLLGQLLQFGKVSFLVARPADTQDATERAEEVITCTEYHSFKSRLTNAQSRVFDGLVRGLSEKEVAAGLHLSPHTVHHHVGAIYRLLGVKSRAEFLLRVLPTS